MKIIIEKLNFIHGNNNQRDFNTNNVILCSLQKNFCSYVYLKIKLKVNNEKIFLKFNRFSSQLEHFLILKCN